MQSQKKHYRFDPVNSEHASRVRVIKSGVASLIIAVLVFFAILLLYPLTSLLPNFVLINNSVGTVNWSNLEGISALITLALIIGGLLFAFLEHTRNTIQAQRQSAEALFNIYKEVYDRLMSDEATAARRWIILNIPTLQQMGNNEIVWLARVKEIVNSSPGHMDTERPIGREYIKHVLNIFDFIGFVASHYWNMESELVEWMSPSIAKVWERVYLYVEDEANRRNEKDFYQSAREFGEYCLKWRRENFQESNIISDGT